jgi:pimeloyl-ACP methyl ester carboxylesterase
LRVLFKRPKSQALEAVADYYVNFFKIIGSPSYPTEPVETRERILAGLKRGYHPTGTLRQMVAVAADAKRPTELEKITCPTLVIHGKHDPLVPYGNGVDTAKRIKGADLVSIDGMGHDLPPGVVSHILDNTLPFMAKAKVKT